MEQGPKYGMVLIVPDLHAHAVYSIGTVTKQGYTVVIEGDTAAVKNSMGTIIVVGHRENNNVYRVSRTKSNQKFWNSDIDSEFPSIDNPAHCNMITKNNRTSNTTNHLVNNNTVRVSSDIEYRVTQRKNIKKSKKGHSYECAD